MVPKQPAKSGPLSIMVKNEVRSVFAYAYAYA